MLHARNITKLDYDLGGLDIGPDWQAPVLDTLPVTQMMREVGVIFDNLEDGVSERREEYDCKDSVDTMPDILFAVKTCSAYHNTRIPVIKNTWARYARDVVFFSDKEDHTIPTIHFPNLAQPRVKTLFGCNKTLAILQYFLDHYPDHGWLVLVDDDTILGVARVLSMLACYTEVKEPIILGKRAGFLTTLGEGPIFPTGGAGIALNKEMVGRLVTTCRCWDPLWMVERWVKTSLFTQ